MASPQSYSLADLLLEAPSLLALLSSQDWAALASCGKDLWRLIHSSVTAITVSSSSDTKAILTGSWPQLAIVKVRPTRAAYWYPHMDVSQGSNLQQIASVHSTTKCQDTAAFLVSPNTEADQHKSIATAFRHLHTLHNSEWQETTSLSIDIYTHGEEVMAQTTQLAWPCVRHLDLRANMLGATHMEQLAKGSWPMLKSLDLGVNQLDDTAMTALVQGNWPLLTSLDLMSNYKLGPAAIALIPSWASLSRLSLAHIKLDGSCTNSIALLHTYLEDLTLNSTDIDATALSQLTACAWPHLKSLMLSGNRLTADAIASLALTEMPLLVCLHLANNKLDAAAARHLATGNWRNLENLGLAGNQLDDSAMAFLAKGAWQNLKQLELHDNNMSVLGLELLVAGQWPQLHTLMLDFKNATAATWALFDLCSEAMPKEKLHARRFNGVWRVFSSTAVDNNVVWPKLQKVHFVPSCAQLGTTSSQSTQTIDHKTGSKPIKPVTRSIGMQCGHTTPFTGTTEHVSSLDQSKADTATKQKKHVGMSPWVHIVSWGAVACGTLWVLKVCI